MLRDDPFWAVYLGICLGFLVLAIMAIIGVAAVLAWAILKPTRFWGHPYPHPEAQEDPELQEDNFPDTGEFFAIIDSNYPDNQF